MKRITTFILAFIVTLFSFKVSAQGSGIPNPPNSYFNYYNDPNNVHLTDVDISETWGTNAQGGAWYVYNQGWYPSQVIYVTYTFHITTVRGQKYTTTQKVQMVWQNTNNGFPFYKGTIYGFLNLGDRATSVDYITACSPYYPPNTPGACPQ